MNDLQKALSLIEAQQKKAGAGTPAWCVGQQLADILNGQPAAAQIVAEDLGTTGMGIADCEKKIAEFASKNRTGNVGFCGPADADRIIREFYGIPKLEIITAKTQAVPAEHRRKAIRQAKRDAEADAVRREAEAADKARKAAERTQKERDRAELEKAQQAAAEAQEQAEALQKKLGIQQSPAGAKFALLFEDVQQKAAAIMDLADEMRDGGQQELADKFTGALAAALRALADQAEGGEA